jgi:thiol-disulfide isomerase/thioredoxin
VAVNNDGYFMIPGLQVGHRYQLTARVQDGGRQLTGSVWATPPDPKLVIRLDQGTQAPVPAAAVPPPQWSPRLPDQDWAPGRGATAPAAPRAAQLGPPTSVPSTTPRPAAPAPDPTPSNLLEPRTRIRPENTVDERSAAGQNDSPEVDMLSQAQARNRESAPPGNPAHWTPAPPPAPPPPPPPSFGPARVPSCVLTGQTLYNFALYDVSGQPWEFRQHTGRLVLLDFWGTWCVPCLQAVPHLNQMQSTYGSRGLEVIGIAYESGTPADQMRKANDMRQKLHINYRVLLGSDREHCPVKVQFAVRAFPTLVLLDESGRIIWRAEGATSQHVRELEIILQQRLGAR